MTTLFDATGFAYRLEGDAVVVTPAPTDAGGWSVDGARFAPVVSHPMAMPRFSAEA